MKFRKLRIAWSVTWGMVAVLLLVLWVRSYWWDDLLVFTCPVTRGVEINSLKGSVLTTVYETSNPILLTGVDLRCLPDPDYLLRDGDSFEVRREYSEVSVLIPHWILITLSAALAITPCLHFPHRFSLRTLLIATTLVAVGLGVIVWAL